MYTYEERMRAVKAYIASGFRTNRTIAQLGYPSHQALRDWYKEYTEKGDLHRDFMRETQYTQRQKEEAIEHYYANGRNLTKTSKALGYAKRDTIRKWVAETLPAEEVDCVIGHAVVKCTEEQKRQAVIAFCARGGSSEKIAGRYGVSHSTLYVWKRKLFENGCAETMAEGREESLEELLKQNAKLKEDIQRLEQQRKALGKDVHRLQLERDILEKAGEILKKEEGVNLNYLSNREKAVLVGALREKYRLRELLSCLKMPKSSYCYQAKAMRRPDRYSGLRIKVKEIFSWDGVPIPQFIRLLDNYMHWHNEDRIKISLNGLSPLDYRRSLHFI